MYECFDEDMPKTGLVLQDQIFWHKPINANIFFFYSTANFKLTFEINKSQQTNN